MRCAALYRVSTARQVTRDTETDETLPVQREAIRAFVRAHRDWSLVAEYSEEGVSAYRHASAERDVLQDVLSAANRREFDLLLVFKADRLSRQAFEYPVILAQLHRVGVTVMSVADVPGGKTLEVEGQFEKLIRFIEGWQAETESYNTSIRVSAAMEQMARQGRWTGGTPPYGYRLAQGTEGFPLAVDAEEAAVIRQMFQWYLHDGIGTVTIAQRLNDLGYRGRKGGQWADFRVRRVMKNPILAGRLAYGRKRRNGSGNHVLRGRDEWDQLILGPFNPSLVIIPPDQWQAAMDKMAAYGHGTNTGPRYSRADQGTLLLTGFAKCADCGGAMVATHGYYWVRRKAGDYKVPRVMYGCLTKITKGPTACPGQRTFAQKKVEDAVIPAILRTLGNIDQAAVVAEARRIAEQSLFHRRTRATQLAKHIAEAERIYAGWLARLDQFFAHPEQSLYSESVLAAKVRESEERLQSLRAQQTDWEQTQQTAAAQLADLERFLTNTANWWRQFLEAPRPRQKALLKHVLDRVVLGRDGYEIYYRLDLSQLVGAKTLAPIAWQEAATWR
ncbi:recombinase family protein [Sulfobacillus sp. DSM 109850]|uniref:Recombinase family protein n=1 Tax=Sulfobacillus harzensis TaxID=2729629 RepID=A0A7Y0Q423_9FIRM|nr:recombinase family protein [Sulfobacillus harzensis]